MSRMIKCREGQVAWVDDEDYEKLIRYYWKAYQNGNTFYPRRRLPHTKYFGWSMYWDILGRPDKGFVIDHIDGDGMNNRKENLRVVTVRQNSQNKHTAKTSQYPGVHRANNKWIAKITIEGSLIQLGAYDVELEAFEAYKTACSIMGEKVLEKVPTRIETVEELVLRQDIERLRHVAKTDGKSPEEIEEAVNVLKETFKNGKYEYISPADDPNRMIRLMVEDNYTSEAIEETILRQFTDWTKERIQKAINVYR